jgi:hypothetical protein
LSTHVGRGHHRWPRIPAQSEGRSRHALCAGAVVTVVVARAVGVVILAFSLLLVLTLAFTVVVEVGGRRGRGRLRAWRFLRRRAWRQLLLRRAPSSLGRGVECGGLSQGPQVVQSDLLEFEVIADGVEGGERLCY